MPRLRATAGVAALLLALACAGSAQAQSSRDTQRKLDQAQRELKAISAERRKLEGQRGSASRDLRTLDCLDEAGFLALECERLGAPELGAAFLDSYARHSGQETGCELRHFYQSVRAVTRATVAIRHLTEPRYRASHQWRERALDYLALARRHLPC